MEVGEYSPVAPPTTFGAAAGFAPFLLLPAPQFNPPGHLSLLGLVLLLCSAATTLGHCGAMLPYILECQPTLGVANALQRPFERARTERTEWQRVIQVSLADGVGGAQRW